MMKNIAQKLIQNWINISITILTGIYYWVR